MHIKIHNKKNKINSEQTISDLNRSVSHSVIGKSKIRLLAVISRLKRFYRDYRLPSIASISFLLIILVFAFIRQLEQTSLLALRNEVTNGGNGYSILLSAESADQFTRNDTSEDQQNNQSTGQNSNPESNSTQSTSNSFTITTDNSPTTSNSGGGGSGGSGSGSGGSVPKAEPFAAAIDYFNQGNTSLQCTNPSKPNKGSCSKLYTVSAGIKSSNGPGTVNYVWQSNIDAGNGSGNFIAGDGSSITSVSKGITLSCSKNSSFTIQIALVSPTFSNSNTITINHNCNEL
jgi:hypothetical protein